MENIDYHFAGEEEMDSPALIYHEDIIKENIQKAIAMAGNPGRMWPHVKTYKTAAIVRLLEAQGITRFKCATIAEAEMCGQCNAQHILVSYPLVGPAIGRFIRLGQRYTGSSFWAIGDDWGQLSLLGQAAASAGFNVPFLVDVNPGMNRTGVALDALKEFCLRAGKIPGLSLMGLHCYDGNLGIKDTGEREKAVAEETEKLMAIRKAVEAEGYKLPVLVLGGTPTFPFHARNREAFLSPGTFFVQDHGYESKYKDLPFSPSAAILTRVISRPREDLFTLDLGYKAISPDQPGERGLITDLPQAQSEGHSEEHWVFRMTSGPCPSIGTVLHVIPTHICPTTALYPGIFVVRDHQLVNYWEVDARNRKILI
ncbi:MAG: D-TA family PLP-dependent enzyme [Treponema sp.]|jgi:D-serine deaminase-like pyridoxal phosphate-dependent protein|nr:D-TA family PLP-dependent enzyme [Treponema sp.]